MISKESDKILLVLVLHPTQQFYEKAHKTTLQKHKYPRDYIYNGSSFNTSIFKRAGVTHPELSNPSGSVYNAENLRLRLVSVDLGV